jgi:predicted nucleic acid-binding protein
LPTSGPPSRLVVDANPILAALLGGQARRVFFETSVREFAVPDIVLSEVREHVPRLARKLGTMPAFLEFALDLLPLQRYPARAYRGKMAEARRRIWRRDPDDIDVLALALRLKAPLWSNDRDFEGTGVLQMTTPDLLKLFFGPSPRPR